MQQQFSSTLLEKAVAEFSKLPGIGRKTALRLVLFMLKRKSEDVELFADTISRMRREVKYCRVCHNISDTDVCPICSDSRRDASTICVVENVQDVLAIENTQQFHGLYHVLHGVLSPMEGTGPEDINLASLISRLHNETVKEVIIATNATTEGEATAMYLSRLIKPAGIKVTRLAHGLSVGSDIEYADEVTLLKAVEGRREL